MLFLAVVLVGSLGAARARQRPVGGEESVPFSRSHIVRFANRPGTDLYGGESWCGGTLLAPDGKVVISAAHCFFTDSGNLITPVGEIVAAVHHDLTEAPTSTSAPP